eukprot:CAMPEP_0170574738 /NCGR_PEP_ID=MMETSP0224-20130122/3466_1 /TAXON_ID=285029 /ORGANISM="Togula jolla, Strain CCCM 725" /LENGTH=527 /DNA_ID=CAMNT_0010897427 /DNA_START=1 /DNA_END=1580 /DNA_ORIENTATION=-
MATGEFLAAPRLDRAFRGHRGSVSAVAVHPDEQQVASGSADGCVFVWHFKPQLRPFRFVGHKGEVHDIAMSSSGQCIASASADHTVRLWNNSPQGDSHTMKVHTAPVRSVCFSRDGERLLTASDDKTVKMWCTATQRFCGSLTGHTHWVSSAAWCKKADTAASGGEDKSVRVWDVERKESIVIFRDFDCPVSKVRFHPDGSSLAASGRDGCVKLWDLRSRRLVQHYSAHCGPVVSIDFHPGGEYLVSAAEDVDLAASMKLWDLRQGLLLHQVAGLSKAPTSCAFSPSGRSFASGGRDNLVCFWDCRAVGVADEAPAPAAGVPKATRASAREAKTEAKPMRSPHRAKSQPSAGSKPSRGAAGAVGATGVIFKAGTAQTTMWPAPVPTLVTASAASTAPRVTAKGSAASVAEPVVDGASDVAGGSTTGADPSEQFELGMGFPSQAANLSSLPQPLAQTLQSMQGHLDLLARTARLLDQRMAMTEAQVLEMRRAFLARGAAGRQLGAQAMQRRQANELTLPVDLSSLALA